MTELEVRENIVKAMDEPKAPQELVEKALKVARAFEKAVAEKNKKAPEKEVPHTDTPFIGGSGLML